MQEDDEDAGMCDSATLCACVIISCGVLLWVVFVMATLTYGLMYVSNSTWTDLTDEVAVLRRRMEL